MFKKIMSLGLIITAFCVISNSAIASPLSQLYVKVISVTGQPINTSDHLTFTFPNGLVAGPYTNDGVWHPQSIAGLDGYSFSYVTVTDTKTNVQGHCTSMGGPTVFHGWVKLTATVTSDGKVLCGANETPNP